MSGLRLLLLFSFFACGSFDKNYTSTENNTSTSEPTRNYPPVSELSQPSPLSKSIQTTTSTSTSMIFLRKECRQESIVCGILIIACAFFLMTTFLLTCKVCKLSRRIRMLSCIVQPNSDSDFLETKNGKSKSGGEDKEIAVLMSCVTQTNQEPDGGKAEDGQKSEDKKEGDSPKSEEALPAAAAVESSTFSQPQEEATRSETTPAAAAAAPSSPSSEATEEPSNQP